MSNGDAVLLHVFPNGSGKLTFSATSFSNQFMMLQPVSMKVQLGSQSNR